eukprot:5497397-Alexandrium_andersonii.AAC.1
MELRNGSRFRAMRLVLVRSFISEAMRFISDFESFARWATGLEVSNLWVGSGSPESTQSSLLRLPPPAGI